MKDKGICQITQYTENIMEVVNKLNLLLNASVPYECHANSSTIGAKIKINHGDNNAELKVGEPEI